MMHSTVLTTSLLLSLAAFSAASPVPVPLSSDLSVNLNLNSKKATAVTEAQIVQIAPKSKSCDNAPAAAKDECATAKTAATFSSKSFDTYKVTSKAEQAAILSLMAFESDDFEYNKNHFPGVAGQGTRNMQSPAFNKKYAESIPALKDKVASVENNPADLLDLLRANETYDFGSGAWFLTTQCSKEVRSALQDGSESGWKKYITDCVETTVTDDRKEYWERAVKALGVN